MDINEVYKNINKLIFLYKSIDYSFMRGALRKVARALIFDTVLSKEFI